MFLFLPLEQMLIVRRAAGATFPKSLARSNPLIFLSWLHA
jgi:hypothetical protein